MSLSLYGAFYITVFSLLAGTVMFEYGMRLGREVRTQLGLQKQVNCYLASLNCLRLIRPDYAWIVQPSSGAVYERPGASPKRNYDGEFATGPGGTRYDSRSCFASVLLFVGL